MPVLLIHARGDNTAKFSVPKGYCVERSLHRYPRLTTTISETGGYLMVGHGQETNEMACGFIDKNG